LEERWLSIKQAAKISSLSPRFLYQACQRRELRFYKVGRRIVIDSEDLFKFITQEPIEPIDYWGEKLRLKNKE